MMTPTISFFPLVKDDDVENNADIKRKTTPLPTIGTLITAMSKIERFLSSDEKDAKKILKSVEGLGTEAFTQYLGGTY